MAKRSKGVLIFGILLVLGCLYSLLASMGSYSDYEFLFQPLSENVIRIRFFISLAMLVAGIIAGVGILLLNDLLRKVAIFTAFYTIATYVIETPLFILKNLPKFFDIKILEVKQGLVEAGTEIPQNFDSIMHNTMWVSTVIGFLVDFGFAVLLIYFFTRSTVKEQFE